MPTFDGINLLITLDAPTDGFLSVDVKEGLYSGWKDWLLLSPLNRGFPPAFRTVAGDPTKPGQTVSPYYFFRNDNGWRIKPYEADQETIVVGNLYREDVTLPMLIPAIGNYQTLITAEVSPQATVVLSGSGVTAQDKTDIADAVWADSDAVQVVADVAFIKDIEGGKWQLTDTQMIFYKADNVTEVARFNITKDVDGNPIMRERV